MTGIGPVAVRCPRVRDRGGEGSERIRFSSAIRVKLVFRLEPTGLFEPIKFNLHKAPAQ